MPEVAGDEKLKGESAAHDKPVPAKEMTNLLAGSTALAGTSEMVRKTPWADDATELSVICGL
jgi:hypothetical protein